MEMETSHLANVKELALTDPDITLYVDGSKYADENGKYHTGYAVTTEKDVIQAFSLPPSMSAQEAELIALTKACEIAAGRRANIYTDSRYALGVTQDFGIIWKARGFMTTAGTPVKHDKAIRELMDALALPEELAILKVKAHGKLNSNEARGNHLADQTAKKAAMISQEMDKKEEKKDINIYTMQTLPTDLKLLKELQKTAEEVNKWKANGAIHKDVLYVDNLRLCLPKNLYPATVQWAHGPAHLSKTLMNALIDKYYMAPDPEVDTGTHQLLPRDWVLVKRFVRKTSLGPTYEGPFQVLLITTTSVYKSPFLSGSFFEKDGLPLCETHYHSIRGSLCAGCEQPITGRCVTAMGRKFHPHHLSCTFYLRQLNKGTFRDHYGKPYCQACYGRLYG
ncbi:LOW QUALITY PROTEIN: uncharacterized protein O3C94_019188 [Discoglossus pictus]